MTGLVVIVFVGIQGWLESQSREDLEKQKESHPTMVNLPGPVRNRQSTIFGAKVLVPLWSFYF